MSEENSLQLNFYVGNEKRTKQKTKYSKKRGTRIKQRRLQKAASGHDVFHSEKPDQPDKSKTIQKTKGEKEFSLTSNKNKFEEEYNTGKVPVNVSSSLKRKHPEDLREVPYKKEKNENKVFISSLFRFNPEIPNVEKSAVARKREEIFSSKYFKDLDLHPFMISNLEERFKITQMTTVQQRAIPQILSGLDVLVKSQTGSGKTLTFAIPVVQHLQGIKPKISRMDGVHALIIVPTRELAIQCFETFKKLVNPFQWVVPGCLMGGEKRKSEKARLRKGMSILVCTPGRLLDHIKHTNSLHLDKVKWLVIDEADRMLDLGYEKDVGEIITALDTESHRQTVLLSATLTEGVERLAGMSLTDPLKIDVSNSEEEHNSSTVQSSAQSKEQDKSENFVVPEKLKQNFVITPCKLRLVTLTAFILLKIKMVSSPGKMVVFLSTQDSVEFHYQLMNHFFGGEGAEENANLAEEGDIDFYKLHGDMPQKERTKTYQEFSTARTGVLFCTDVAARGLHLPDVRWIVQYTTPGAVQGYVHRVGRTARVGKQGHALLFLMPAEVEYLKSLASHGISVEEVNMADILKTLIIAVQDMVSETEKKRTPSKTFEECATYLQLCFENHVAEDKKMSQLARRAFQSFVRAYATYPSSLKTIFHVRNLHLGHLAKSFGLRDAPSNINEKTGKQKTFTKKQKSKKDRFGSEGGGHTNKSHFSSLTVSEFSSGLSKASLSKQKH
ncbi:probable ATP-dependent RNA helicase DDX31 [Saccostrea echinata]|uniref:probable ATP-dependent RNA helicase DDX31 n=1 Tax=Saccostrea echinata TaxID=191078 RepID=UPI002A7FB5D2|nr:probable ATP-dependent RNA helicase DDX31 [Saccostrea echinata]